jgi:hypothetical protein
VSDDDFELPPGRQAVSLSLPQFEGPLDLLLHRLFVRSHEVLSLGARKLFSLDPKVIRQGPSQLLDIG